MKDILQKIIFGVWLLGLYWFCGKMISSKKPVLGQESAKVDPQDNEKSHKI